MVPPFRECCEPKSTSNPEVVAINEETGPALCAREEDVEALVKDFLKDPSINIPTIPDSVERLIYKSTTQLTLNAFYNIFSNLEGIHFMAHQIHLRITRGLDQESQSCSSVLMEPRANTVDDVVLQEMAAHLLDNKTCSQKFLPDRVEHALYSNCLKVVFRVLDVLTSSLHLTICGHEIGLFLEPAAWQDLLENSTTSSSLYEIDHEKLREFARVQAGVTEELGSYWESIFVPQEFVTRTHASLYGLILGIVDDMLANTKIEILSDYITLDLSPLRVSGGGNTRSKDVQQAQANKQDLPLSSKSDECETTEHISLSSSENGNVPQSESSEDPDALKSQMASVGFETERLILLQRFQEMTPEQRAIVAKDLNDLLGEGDVQA